ncbi:MAG: hypothetical protein ACK2US_04980 [Anaerolineae bacterium]|jgi:hypothetical protein
MNLKLAYLSQGKLFFKHGDLAARQIDSQFGQEIISRTIQRHQRDEWKFGERESPFSGSMLWGAKQATPDEMRVNVTSATSSDQGGELVYFLETGYVGGLFSYNWTNDEEKRIFHKEAFHIRDIDRHPELDLIACAQLFPGGMGKIGIIKGLGLHQITEGDSVDLAPSWIPGKGQEIVFQSAGIARNPKGRAVGLGPFTIQRLNPEKGSLTPLLDDPEIDFLLPHLDADGTLYFIRRPYEMPGRSKPSLWRLATDVLLFPFRLLRALFHYMNFVSLAFSRKPLATAAGPKTDGPDEHTLMLWGRMIDAQKALRENAQAKETPALVPSSWELVKRQPSGEETILAKSVVAYDIDPANNVVYTNGSAIYRVDSQGNSQLVAKGNLIQSVVIIR